MSECVLLQTDSSGKTSSHSCGVLFDIEGKLVDGTVRRGRMQDEMLVEDASGDLAFVLKEPDGGMNTCNAAWANWSTWNSSW